MHNLTRLGPLVGWLVAAALVAMPTQGFAQANLQQIAAKQSSSTSVGVTDAMARDSCSDPEALGSQDSFIGGFSLDPDLVSPQIASIKPIGADQTLVVSDALGNSLGRILGFTSRGSTFVLPVVDLKVTINDQDLLVALPVHKDGFLFSGIQYESEDCSGTPYIREEVTFLGGAGATPHFLARVNGPGQSLFLPVTGVLETKVIKSHRHEDGECCPANFEGDLFRAAQGADLLTFFTPPFQTEIELVQ